MTGTAVTYRKKLIEVALPLEAINREAAREKSIRHGHPSTLHLWWARRPLAACRAVLFASLVNDPDHDPLYSVDSEIAGLERAKLFDLIEALVKWENSNNPTVINRARAEIARSIAVNNVADGKWKDRDVVVGGTEQDVAPTTAGDFKHKLASPEAVNAFLAEHAPPVLDPFAGGGSIPLEAQRLGLRAYASDLNPVPVLINKALIEIPPKFANQPPVNPESRKQGRIKGTWKGAEGLAEDVRYYGKWMRDEAEKRIGHLYPKVKVTAEMAKDRPDLKPYVGQELTVIAWLWARAVKCPNPTCGARAPLVRSFWVCTKKDQSCFVEPVIDRTKKSVQFRIQKDGSPPKHTTDRTGGRCMFCERFIKKPELREISVNHGLTELPFAIVAEGIRERVYLDGDLLSPPSVPKPSVPFLDQPITNDRRWFSPPLYGMPRFSDLFTTRQLTALATFSDLIASARAKVLEDAVAASPSDTDPRPLDQRGTGPQAYADAVATYLAFAIDKAAEGSTTLCTWSPLPTKLHVVSTFGRQALPMVWDFAEANPFAESSGNIARMTELVGRVISRLTVSSIPGEPRQADAASASMPHSCMVSTDPPYYDNIGYADLSDFFYVWLRRSLGSIFPQLFTTVLTPKSQELIAASYRHEDNATAARRFFEDGLERCFVSARKATSEEYPLTIFYAFKQAEDETNDGDPSVTTTVSTGWETMLEAVIRAGFLIDGTWPVRTEREGGFRNKDQNALASSIVLSCRPRPIDAPLATRREFLNLLKRELPEALKQLQRGSIAPVDLAQAAIGPGMAVFSSYAKVMEADGAPMKVRQALALINQTLDEVLAEQEGEFDSDTRWALAWFEQFSMEEGQFGVAETLSKAKNTAVNALVEAGIVKARSGKVRLLRRDELPADWDPGTDERLRHWEIVQHLIRALETDGEEAAADLLRRVGGLGEAARDLAYRLYNICERKKWASEALAYNGLVIAWPEISRLALSGGARAADVQSEMF